MKNILTSLLVKKQNNKQRDFLSKLVPTVDKKLILGVKNPEIREIAKNEFDKNQDECIKYIKKLPHKYLEEYILHTSILERIKDYDLVIKEIDRVLPYIDNWATCDTYSPKIFKKNPKDAIKHIKKWIKAKKTYTIRFGIQALMSFYLDDEMYPEQSKDLKELTDTISKIRFKSKYKYKKESQKECPDKYYVDMMIAWYFATLLAKNYKLALPYIKNKKLESWTHNMTVRKACESYRIDNKTKILLKRLI